MLEVSERIQLKIDVLERKQQLVRHHLPSFESMRLLFEDWRIGRRRNVYEGQSVMKTVRYFVTNEYIRTWGLMLSNCLHISSPWMLVHLRIGDPPPILAYCSVILGVLRRAIQGPTTDCAFPIGMISGSQNRFSRKLPTSFSVDGPPIFIIAIAVLGTFRLECMEPYDEIPI